MVIVFVGHSPVVMVINLFLGDIFSKPFSPYLDEDAVYNFINSMMEESNLCTDIMNKHFNKEIVMTENNNKDFENSTKCWI